MRVIRLILLAVVASSCFNEGDCLITNSNLIKVSLKDFKDKKTAVNKSFTSISVLGDTVLYKNTTAIPSFVLPVDPGKTEMTYVFQYEGKSDTLVFRYNNLTVVLSPTCGAFPYQRNLEITGSTFGQDSTVVVNQNLTKDAVENARIYF